MANNRLKPGEMTLKERKFLKKLLDTGSPQAAALEAYDVGNNVRARELAHNVLKKPRIKAILQEMVEAEGLDTPSLAKVFKKWIESDDGHVAHKWTMSYLDTIEPDIELDPGPKVLHAHQHVHFEGMSDQERKFVLVNGRYPTAQEVNEMEGIVEDSD